MNRFLRLSICGAVLFLVNCGPQVVTVAPPAPTPPQPTRVYFAADMPDDAVVCVERTAWMHHEQPALPVLVCGGSLGALREFLMQVRHAD